MKKITFLLAAALVSSASFAQNPYLPLWEFIPDGEPYLFEDPDCPGKMRVYVYGSHDNLVTEYCGRDQVVWSAPEEDLTNWRYDGVIFVSDVDAEGAKFPVADVLFAPDVALKILPDGSKKYYLYPNNQAHGRESMICVSDRPDGPFTVCNWSKEDKLKTEGILGFDPAVFVDDDGRVYGYWGIEKSHGAELDPQNMASLKQGTKVVENMVSNLHEKDKFRFFEASSIRKIEDKYVFIYSRWAPDGDFGLPNSNYTLAYAYSDNPLGPYTYGGTIIDARARDLDASGKVICTANPFGNTHGSILEANGQWWVFYHRQNGTDCFSRQAMVAPITVKVEKGKGGKVSISEGEYNSEGFRTEGLNPLERISAGWACYHTNPEGITEKYPQYFFTGSYHKATRLKDGSTKGAYNLKESMSPLTFNTAGSVVGWKYLNFDKFKGATDAKLTVHLGEVKTAGRIVVLAGGPSLEKGGREIASLPIQGTYKEGFYSTKVSNLKGLKGKQGLFMRFESDIKGVSVCDLYDIQFTCGK